MKTLLFFAMCLIVLAHLAYRCRQRLAYREGLIDAIIPAFNEEPCIARCVTDLLRNPYIDRIVCVNDGSTDGTADVLARLAQGHPRVLVVNQANTGKGGAIMHGLRYVTAPYVFLTDADTYVPPRSHGLGYMIAEMERGAHAVGGIPSSDLRGGGVLGTIRATVKLPMIVVKRTFQQILGGAPFIISGACGLFRTRILREVGLSDRTKVEDLDLTWTLVAMGYKVRQANRCVVYPQECCSLREDWRRWRRWIMGYAVCMRLHRSLLLTRFGLFSILPMFLVVILGIGIYSVSWTRLAMSGEAHALPFQLFPILWLAVIGVVGTISAIHHRAPWLVVLAPFAVLYVLLSYAVWLVHGFKALFTGRELGRDKPTRVAHVVA